MPMNRWLILELKCSGTCSVQHQDCQSGGQADQEETLVGEFKVLHFFIADDLCQVNVIVLAQVDAVHRPG